MSMTPTSQSMEEHPMLLPSWYVLLVPPDATSRRLPSVYCNACDPPAASTHIMHVCKHEHVSVDTGIHKLSL